MTSMRATSAGLLLLVFATSCGPFLLLPGGELEGTDVPVPADWSLLADRSTVQIETRPEDPYSVNIWAVGMGSVVYIHAGANRSKWVEHLETNPALRLRVDEDIYALRATRVETQEEFNTFSDAYEEKYSVRPRNETVGQVYLFRLEGA
jgi:hypothetical protein